ncbi:MAG: gliding motility-associated C-terminal domain-containing protein [Chitinophagales bacterium]|nr:gliding motility-associated C-terminal domain-containing protein [Chitinophagales bacterium]MDW8394185.1 gliding motility-associated C-terminal domain-containing protein [Chitinophagales bacterium]
MQKQRLLTLLSALFSSCLFAQLPEQDCINALPVCQSTYVQAISYYQEGATQEITYPSSTSCLVGGEENSVWYIFTVTASGTLEMQITPVSPFDDYDWAIYNLTNSDCSGIANGTAPEVRCNYSAIPGSTGMSFPYVLTSVPAAGPNQCAPLPVTVGETYVLLINNHANTLLGYTLAFSGTAVIYDTVKPKPVMLDPLTCDPPAVLHLTLSESIRCNSLNADGSDFYITGPSTVTVSGAHAPACDNGSFFTEVDIFLASPISLYGDYELHFKNDNLFLNTLLDNCGNSLPLSESVPFHVGIPRAEFTYSVVKTCTGDSVYFTDNSVGDSLTSWVWDLDAGQSGSGQTISAFYPNTGTYSITLSITDSTGCVDDTTLQISTQTVIPEASFTITPGPYCVGDTIFCTDASSGLITSYNWNLGGTISSQQNPFYIIPSDAPFNIWLTVTDYIGCTDDTLITIEPIPPLQASFTVSPNHLCVGDPITLSDNSLGNPTDYLWSGPGITGMTSTTVTTTVQQAGTYEVFLYISDNLCTPDTASQMLNVYDYPIVNLGPDTAICIDETLLLNAGNPGLYHQWHNGDLSQTYLVTQVPQLVWVLVDNNGCTSTDTLRVGSACPFFIPNAFTPNNDGINDEFRIYTDGNQEFEFKIFNRWGQLLFQTNDPSKGWDGRYQGVPQEMGVYVYALETLFTNGTRKVRTGNLTLIR